jgi:hypothetical protein
MSPRKLTPGRFERVVNGTMQRMEIGLGGLEGMPHTLEMLGGVSPEERAVWKRQIKNLDRQWRKLRRSLEKKVAAVKAKPGTP